MATRTVGVEEELMLVDPVDGRPASAGDVVLEAAQEWLVADADHQVEREFKMEQTEIGSSPTTDIPALRAELLGLRRSVAPAAGRSGVLRSPRRRNRLWRTVPWLARPASMLASW